MNKDRILFLDTARSLAMLWIVCYWHVKDYVEVSETREALSLFGDFYITDVMLGLFMFLSGFFMAKYTFTHERDIANFYKKRLTRFYLLYALSAILLFIIGFNRGFGLLITTLTVSSTYILPQPQTLWFLSMLASFYILTPLLLKDDCKVLIVRSLQIFSGGVILHLLLPKGIDTRFFWCFPLYCIGIYFGKKRRLMNLITTKTIGISSTMILIVLLILLQNYYQNNLLLHYLVLPFGIISILNISKFITKLPIEKVIEIIAYCSMCAYIFHRVFYSVLKKVIYGIIGYDFSYPFCFMVFIPVCLIGSYLIQMSYDRYVLPKLNNLIDR